jgi:U3 small nucleolar RNA-associated protein 12
VFKTKRNEVTCIEKLPGEELSYVVGTDSEDLIFLNFGDFGKDEESKLRVYCRERGRFVREFYGRVDQIGFDEKNKALFLLSNRRQVEVLKFRSSKEVVKKFKRRKKRAEQNGKEFEFNKEEFMKDIGNWVDALHNRRLKGKVDSFLLAEKIKDHKNLVYFFKSNNSFVLEQYSFDNQVQFESKKDFLKLSHQNVIRAVDLSSDDSMVLSCSIESVKIWSTTPTPSSPESFQRIKNYSLSGVMSCKFLPKDRYILLGHKNGALSLLDLQSSEIIQTIEDAHTDTIWSIDVHSNPSGAAGIRILTGSADSTAKFWELRLKDSKLALELSSEFRAGEAVQWVKYSPNGEFYFLALLDNSIMMNYADTGKLKFFFYGHKMPVLSIDVSSDDALLVSGSADKYLRIWGTDFGDCHKHIFAHKGPVTQVKFIRDTHYILSCGRDGMVRYWDGDSKEMIMEIEASGGDLWALGVSSIGDFFVVAGKDKILRTYSQTKDLVYIQLESRDREEKVNFNFPLKIFPLNFP